MNRSEFEQASRKQNERRAAEVTEARATGAPCTIVDMLALGDVPYCTTPPRDGPLPVRGGEVNAATKGRMHLRGSREDVQELECANRELLAALRLAAAAFCSGPYPGDTVEAQQRITNDARKAIRAAIQKAEGR